MSENSVDPRYPIGKYEPQPYSDEQRKKWLNDLAFLPSDLEFAIQNLDEFQLDTPYREGGWTVKQVVHHVADSHINAYIRFKLIMTEDNVVLKPYEEKDWAVLKDVYSVPVNVSITLLHALHRRWVAAIEDLSEADLCNRSGFHPEHQIQMSLWRLLGMYVWHGKHHVAHITSLKQQKGW